MSKFVQAAKQFWNDEEGVTAIEYALIVAVMGALIVAAWNTTLGTAIKGVFSDIAAKMAPAA